MWVFTCRGIKLFFLTLIISLDLEDSSVGQKMSGTFQPLPSEPKQSARYEEGQGDTPNYRGYTNPDLQSASFKRIQEELDKQEDCMHDLLCCAFFNIYVNQQSGHFRLDSLMISP